tara:strand:- start:869 stop:1132 length:264 start_codon:yes stop_codon:yes gene_type:complete
MLISIKKTIKKIFIIKRVFLLFLIAFLTIAAESKKNFENQIPLEPLNLNNASNSNIDFMCYNMCKETTKGLNILELEKFCRKQCPLK